MLKLLVVLAIGVGIGYGLGYRDAKAHRQPIVTRLVQRVGGSNRAAYRNDVDARMQQLER